MKKLYLLFPLSVVIAMAIGQPKPVRCYSYEHLLDQVRQNAERGKSLDALDKKVDDIITTRSGSFLKGKPGGEPRSNTVYIPVVVNVVYNNAEENISDAQVQSQIDVLNKDFSARNMEILNNTSYNFAGYFEVVANCKIQFCLHKVVRTATTVTSFSTNDAMKKTSMGGQDPLNPSTMLNIWSCNLGDDILGYAQFPSGPVKTDGVVILYSAFGTSAAGASLPPYDEGRTATHEIGHWLGLRHIWGDKTCGNDHVTDTPPQDGPNFGCPTPGLVSTCKTPSPEQYMNYMDYVVDLCMYMFTKGQLERMNGYIAANRSSYCLASCTAPASPAITGNSNKARMATALPLQQLLVYPTVTQDLTTVVIPSNAMGTGEILLFSAAGTLLRRQQIALTKNGNTSLQLHVGNLSNGIYLIQITNAAGNIETRKLVVQH